MKKFWMISMLLLAALFVISCGEAEVEDATSDGNCTEGQYRCDGQALKVCGSNGFWTLKEDCNGETPKCNAEKGTCEAASENGGDNGDNNGNGGDNGNGGNNEEPTNPTDPTNEPTTPNQDAMQACAAIYECFAQCQDNNCATACVENGDPAGQEVFMTMYNCWSNNCASASTNEEFTDCVVANCNAETEACGLRVTPAEGDPSYNATYGSLSISFSVDQIANDSDANNQQSTVGITQAAFATGTYGNGSTSVTPADAYMIQSMASYYEQSQNGQLYKGIQVQQIPVYVQGNQGVGGNPLVILDIPEDSAAVGAIKTSLYQDGQAQLYVVDVNWSTSQISCFHAFGEGTVNITNIGDIANHGALAINGNVTLYSPKNYDGNGDISSQLGVPVCNPVQ